MSFVEGEFVHPQQWSEEALPQLGRLLRELHNATGSFSIPGDAAWRDWHGRRLGNPEAGIGHCDTGPWNIVARDSLPLKIALDLSDPSSTGTSYLGPSASGLSTR